MAPTTTTRTLLRSVAFTARRLERGGIGRKQCYYPPCSSMWDKGRSSMPMAPRFFSTSSIKEAGESAAPMTRPPVTRFTEDEEMIRDAVRSWVATELLPVVREMDNEAKLRPEILESLFAQGFMGMEVPEEYGGSSLSFTSACLAVEEISRVDPSVAILVDIHNTLTNNAVRFWGSPELQENWLPRLATDTVSSFCLSEAGSGSDAFAMKTTATSSSDGSYYTLNGSKLWISNAKEAGVFLVFANADPSKGYKGITAFMVDAETEGIEVGRPENKLGLRASSTCPLILENVKVDAANVLGEVGLGYRYCINILNEGRIGIAAQQIGIAKGCMDIALPYMMERKQFGKPIADFQGLQHQYAQIATEIHAAEVMTYNACRMKENGIPFVKEASMAKLYSSQVAEKAASKTIEWLGGIGFTKDLLAEKFYRDCKVGSIYGKFIRVLRALCSSNP
jgi:short/branched chain acyl-CoA dehydrogenase